MIPNNSTPIKNEVLIEIFAKGKLNQTEMRIVAYVMRWSWGFDLGERRQDWTKPISISKVAKDIGLSRWHCSTAIRQMIKEKKLFRESSQYQFNEHYDEWVLPNRNSVTKVEHSSQAKVLPKWNTSVTKP